MPDSMSNLVVGRTAQCVSIMFNFGMGYGILQGVLASLHLVERILKLQGKRGEKLIIVKGNGE